MQVVCATILFTTHGVTYCLKDIVLSWMICKRRMILLWLAEKMLGTPLKIVWCSQRRIFCYWRVLWSAESTDLQCCRGRGGGVFAPVCARSANSQHNFWCQMSFKGETKEKWTARSIGNQASIWIWRWFGCVAQGTGGVLCWPQFRNCLERSEYNCFFSS